jgi:hypothetical protein
MSNSPEPQAIDERERRRQLRQKGWALCLEGAFVAGIGGLGSFLFWWFSGSGRVPGIGSLIIGSLFCLAGLVKIVRGWDRSGT